MKKREDLELRVTRIENDMLGLYKIITGYMERVDSDSDCIREIGPLLGDVGVMLKMILEGLEMREGEV